MGIAWIATALLHNCHLNSERFERVGISVILWVRAPRISSVLCVFSRFFASSARSFGGVPCGIVQKNSCAVKGLMVTKIWDFESRLNRLRQMLFAPRRIPIDSGPRAIFKKLGIGLFSQ